MTATVSSKPETIAGVGAGRIRLDVIQVAAHDQVEAPIAVHVVGDDRPDRSDLREGR